MNSTKPLYSKKRYEKIIKESPTLRKLASAPNTVAFVPISSCSGDNILEPRANTNMAGSRDGKSPIKMAMLEALDCILPPSLQLISLCACLSRISSKLIVLVLPRIGQELVCSNLDMVLTFAPVTYTVEMKSIEMHRQALNEAVRGDSVSIRVKNVSVRDAYGSEM